MQMRLLFDILLDLLHVLRVHLLHFVLGLQHTHTFLQERPDVFCSLCMAAAHMAAQDLLVVKSCHRKCFVLEDGSYWALRRKVSHKVSCLRLCNC